MADKTGIEWTDATWNAFTGCTAVSPGCDRCYAASLASGRLAHVPAYEGLASGGVFNGKVRLLPDRLDQPLRWTRPRRIFVNSMSDAFHEGVPDEYLARVFAVMHDAEQHSFQVLTKRHGRMRSLLNSERFRGLVVGELAKLRAADEQYGDPHLRWPVPNVWLGVSVEDQKWADIRIPALIDTPAAVRFLSCEPLLGPVDLTPYIGGTDGGTAEPRGRGLSGSGDGRVGDRRAGPSVESGGSPGRPEPAHGDDSLRAAQGGAPLGQIPPGPRHVRRGSGPRTSAPAGLAACRGADPRGADGEPQERERHGELALEPGVGDLRGAGQARSGSAPARAPRSVGQSERDGQIDDGSGSRDLLASGERGEFAGDRGGLRGCDADDLQDSPRRPAISWVICGGESGRGARPMHPGWPRSLRDQCQAAGVAYLYKQWGEWALRHSDRPRGPRAGAWDEARVSWVTPAGETHPFGDFAGTAEHMRWALMQRVGKHAAGRVLDGRTWDEYPEGSAA